MDGRRVVLRTNGRTDDQAAGHSGSLRSALAACARRHKNGGPCRPRCYKCRQRWPPPTLLAISHGTRESRKIADCTRRTRDFPALRLLRAACRSRTHTSTRSRTHARTLVRSPSGSVSLKTERAERNSGTLYLSVVNNSSTVSTHIVLRRVGEKEIEEDTGSDRANPRRRAGGREGRKERKRQSRKREKSEEDGDRAIERAKTSPSPPRERTETDGQRTHWRRGRRERKFNSSGSTMGKQTRWSEYAARC